MPKPNAVPELIVCHGCNAARPSDEFLYKKQGQEYIPYIHNVDPVHAAEDGTRVMIIFCRTRGILDVKIGDMMKGISPDAWDRYHNIPEPPGIAPIEERTIGDLLQTKDEATILGLTDQITDMESKLTQLGGMRSHNL